MMIQGASHLEQDLQAEGQSEESTQEEIQQVPSRYCHNWDFYVYDTNYPWVVGGNEPPIPSYAIYKHGQFTVVGCSVLRLVEVVFQLMDRHAYEGSEDGHINVPKLFVIDSSIHVYTAWIRLRALMPYIQSINELKKEIYLSDFFYDLSVSAGKATPFSRFFKRLQSFCLNEKDFQLFKNVVMKSDIICGNWLDYSVMEYIQSLLDGSPLCIYASNLPEFTHFYSNALDVFLDNVMSLNPANSIFTITELSLYMKYRRLLPEVIIRQTNAVKDEHLEALYMEGSSSLSYHIKSRNLPALTPMFKAKKDNETSSHEEEPEIVDSKNIRYSHTIGCHKI